MLQGVRLTGKALPGMNSFVLRHRVWYAMRRGGVALSWHHAPSPTSRAREQNRALSANLGPRLLINLAYC
jgi:hypothetical protein